MIQSAVGDGSAFGLQVVYSHDGERLLGTAGAVRAALPKLEKNFFAIYGDSYLVCDYAAVEDEFSRSGKLGLMTVFRNDGQWDTSNVEFENGRIQAYSKKHRTPQMCFIDYGLGVFQAKAFSKSQATDLADVYTDLLRADELAAIEVHERFYEIGSPAGLEEMNRFLSQRRNARK
jgi:NDP-sugar pyrophosphorylase family protein